MYSSKGVREKNSRYRRKECSLPIGVLKISMKKYDVVALGELLIDFTENGISPQGNPVFEANAGGAPCNVLAMLSRLGKKTAFIGKVGNDNFGRSLKKSAEEAGIDMTGLAVSGSVPTTLAFVHTLADGDREFSFYRNPGADMTLSENEVNLELVKACRIFHFGSLSMTDEGCRRATEKAIDAAKEAGAILSFDPNLREPLWNRLEEAAERIAYGMSKCDILKISDNEILWFTGCKDYDSAVEMILKSYANISLLIVTFGKKGSRAYMGGITAEMPSFQVKTIETTGAGDTFCGCVLNFVLENGFQKYSEEQLKNMLIFANAAAAAVTTRKGALRVMPGREEIEKMCRERK